MNVVKTTFSRLGLVGVLCVVLVSCGGGDDPEPAPEVAGDADPADVEVIEEWSTALREGDVEAAAAYFRLPSRTENGIVFEIETVADAERFNASLPCGAELVEAETEGEFTTATFRLTERPGPGTCGAGTGETAQTAFVIEDGKIVEWRRVALPGAPATGQPT